MMACNTNPFYHLEVFHEWLEDQPNLVDITGFWDLTEHARKQHFEMWLDTLSPIEVEQLTIKNNEETA